MMNNLALWVLSLMTQLQPSAPWSDTYPATAAAIAEASQEQPVFAGQKGPHRTAALLVSLSWFESNFNARAMGDCDKGKPRSASTCRSFGLFQVARGNGLVPVEVAMEDANIATREALRMIRLSQTVCRGRPAEDLLGWYAAGGQGCRGLTESHHRVWKAQHLERAFPFVVLPGAT